MARLWKKDKQFLSYLAGFVDGEGTIGVNKRNRLGRWVSYDPYLAITNTDLGVLNYIYENIGFGSVRNKKTSKSHYGRRPCFSYWASNKNARIIIRAILPYLIIKKDQAEIVLEMPKRGGTFTPNEEERRKDLQENAYWELKILHGREVDLYR